MSYTRNLSSVTTKRKQCNFQSALEDNNFHLSFLLGEKHNGSNGAFSFITNIGKRITIAGIKENSVLVKCLISSFKAHLKNARTHYI